MSHNYLTATDTAQTKPDTWFQCNATEKVHSTGLKTYDKRFAGGPGAVSGAAAATGVRAQDGPVRVLDVDVDVVGFVVVLLLLWHASCLVGAQMRVFKAIQCDCRPELDFG